jgi:hypothetical protein
MVLIILYNYTIRYFYKKIEPLILDDDVTLKSYFQKISNESSYMFIYFYIYL